MILTVLVVQFDPVSYTVEEGDPASLRVVLSFAADRPVTVDVATSDGSATGMDTQSISCTCRAVRYVGFETNNEQVSFLT